MVISCGKRSVTLVWCIFECLFFSGLLNGWIWMQEILKEEGYFSQYCNTSQRLTKGLRENSADAVENTVTTFNQRRKPVCVYKLVLKEFVQKAITTSLSTAPGRENLDVEHKPMNITHTTACHEQDNSLEFVLVIVVIIRSALMFPLGIFLDKYGTSRTRIFAMICIAFGSLTMLFSSGAYPWLILPALLILSLSGMLILLTDLQIANLFGPYRYTVMSTLVGSYHSGGLVILLKKIVHSTGITIQTSFMFVAIGIVPVLISTIAMLPKSRIPWPLPANYGSRKRADFAEDKCHRNQAWQIRPSDSTKGKGDMADFLPYVKNKLFICMVIWQAILCFKTMVFDINLDLQLQHTDMQKVTVGLSLYATIMLFSLPFSPLVGLAMDSAKCQQVHQQQYHNLQMRNILYVVFVNYVIAICSSVTSLFPSIYLQVIAFVFAAIEKTLMLSTFFAFLTHVHFSNEHFGKLTGLSIAVTGIFDILYFVLNVFTNQGQSKNTYYVHICMLLLLLIAACHPISLWYHCRTGLITNNDLITQTNLQTLSMIITKDIVKTSQEEDANDIEEEHDTKAGFETAMLQVTEL